MREKLGQFQCMQVRVADKEKNGIPGTVMVEPKSCPRAERLLNDSAESSTAQSQSTLGLRVNMQIRVRLKGLKLLCWVLSF